MHTSHFIPNPNHPNSLFFVIFYTSVILRITNSIFFILQHTPTNDSTLHHIFKTITFHLGVLFKNQYPCPLIKHNKKTLGMPSVFTIIIRQIHNLYLPNKHNNIFSYTLSGTPFSTLPK